MLPGSGRSTFGWPRLEDCTHTRTQRRREDACTRRARTPRDSWVRRRVAGLASLPLHRQHPIRGSFLDGAPMTSSAPRSTTASTSQSVTIGPTAVRPPAAHTACARNRRSRVTRATPHGVRELIDIAHFRYEHVDALVRVGRSCNRASRSPGPGTGDWHVHLGELLDLPDGRRAFVNPLRPGGKLAPISTQQDPRRRGGALLHAGNPVVGAPACQRGPLPASRPPAQQGAAFGNDRRARSDRRPAILHRLVQSQEPWLAAPHHPYRVAVSLAQHGTGRVWHDQDVFAQNRCWNCRPDKLRPRHRAKPAPQAAACAATHRSAARACC